MQCGPGLKWSRSKSIWERVPMQAEFIGDGGLWPIGGGDWRVTHGWGVRAVDDDGTVYEWTVPVGFITDLASIPRLPLIYMALGGKGPKSAVVHDMLYKLQVGKDLADRVFRALLVIEEDPEIAEQMFAGVRIGGGAAYASYGPNPPGPPHPGLEVQA